MREPGGVRLGEQREQAALVLGVVEDHDLVGGRGGVELAALVAVRDRDRQADARGRDRGAVERDAALHQRAEHGEEAAARARDGRRVRAVLRDVAVPVEQVGPRDPHVVEPQPAVVDAVEAALEPVVLAADAGQELQRVRVADRHVEGVHAVVDAGVMSRAKTDGRRAVLAGVAEVVLPRRAERRVDDELLRGRVVRRGGADGGDVRAVARLGHREGAGHLDRQGVGQELVVVALGAQVVDRRGEQAPLHARLDLQRRVGVRRAPRTARGSRRGPRRRRTARGTSGARRPRRRAAGAGPGRARGARPATGPRSGGTARRP